jgi:type I restriction enzyme R subunit
VLAGDDALVEQPAIALLEELGWTAINAYHEFDHGKNVLGRETRSEIILNARLMAALQKHNPGTSSEALEQAIIELNRDRSRMSPAAANREVYGVLNDGGRAAIPAPGGDGETTATVRIMRNCGQPGQQRLSGAAHNIWVTGRCTPRRADLVGFVNGIPLLFIELTAAHKRLETAFTGNLRDYKDTIPHLFWPNGLIILSNGSQSRVGSVTAGWEHFAEWKKIGSENEKAVCL